MITRSYQPFRPHAGGDGVLFRLGESEETLGFREARSREEVMAAIDAGLPSRVLKGVDAHHPPNPIIVSESRYKPAMRCS